jgi:hypothetical protein
MYIYIYISIYVIYIKMQIKINLLKRPQLLAPPCEKKFISNKSFMVN